MPVSSNTFVTQIEFDPDIGGVSVGSMMMKPICARGLIGGTSKFTCKVAYDDTVSKSTNI